MEALYRYVAETPTGAVVKGALNAATRDDAAQRLRAERLAPISIRETSKSSWGAAAVLAPKDSLPLGLYARLCSALGDLDAAGVPIAEALRICAVRESSPKATAFLNRVLERVRGGVTLSQALKNDRADPPRLLIAMTAAAEQTGSYAPHFKRLGVAFEATDNMRKDVVGQLIYPVALLALIAATIVFLSFYVLPQFETVFAAAEVEPPPMTQVVIAAGAFIRGYWLLFPISVFGGLAAFTILASRHKSAVHRFLATSPFVGVLVKKHQFGAFSRSLGALLSEGASLAPSMSAATQAVANVYLRGALARASEHIRAGESVTDQFDRSGAAPRDALSLIAIGEQSGRLGAMLLKAADVCDEDVRNAMKRAASILGPMLTAIMGAIVAGVVASVLTGVMGLNDAIY